jgi:TPR repeat protein
VIQAKTLRGLVLMIGVCLGCLAEPAAPGGAVTNSSPAANRLGTTEELAELRRKAEAGSPQHQVALGLRYQKGKGLPANPKEALKWFRKAASKGFGPAEYLLGLCYANGEGVKADAAEAARWYKKGAEHNHFPSQYNLGLIYAQGKGVKQDMTLAAHWFEQAAYQGDPFAAVAFGIANFNGQGVATNIVEALAWIVVAQTKDIRGESTIPNLRQGIAVQMTDQQRFLAARRVDEIMQTMMKKTGKPPSTEPKKSR